MSVSSHGGSLDMSIIILFDGHIHLCHMVSVLNFAAGFDVRDEFFAINETLIKAAFRSCSKEFCISYKFMGIDKGGEDRVFSARVKKGLEVQGVAMEQR